jgi:hypothetical protein
MEQFSWPEHFRNVDRPARNWRSTLSSGMITMPAPAGPFVFGTQMLKQLTRIRRARFNAVYALIFSLILVCAVWCCAAGAQTQDAASSKSTTAKSSTKKSATTKSSTAHAAVKHSRKKKTVRVRGQQKIDPDRAREIQEALIREHYLTGDSTGTWNQASEDAMRRYQEDHGWQTKEVPDSRALIKLGLGPSKDHLLNPESAMTTVPDAPRSDSPMPTSHTTAPVSNLPTQTPAQSDSSQPQ